MTLDDETLAALAEGRLTEGEAAAVVALLREDGPARAAFRDLFPEAYRALLEMEVTPTTE